MSRPIVSTTGPGLARSEAVRFAGISLIVGVIILLIFAGLAANSRKNGSDASGAYQQTGPSSSMGAPAPQAT